jgi:hypothetical protein
MDVVDLKAIASYWQDTIPGLIGNILCKQFPDMPDSERIPIPVIQKLPPHQTDIATLCTMDINEGTIKGNLGVLEIIAVKQLGVSLEELIDRVIPISGDQLTIVCIKTTPNQWVCDVKEQRFKWAHTLNGFLHIRIALLHIVFTVNIGSVKSLGR